MNKVISLYIVFGLFLLLIVIESILYSSKKDLEIVYQDFKECTRTVTAVKEFKKNYSLKHMQKLQKILKSNYFSTTKFKIDFKLNSMKVESKNMSIKDLNYLFSKLLNDHYPISKFEIVHTSAVTVRIALELKW